MDSEQRLLEQIAHQYDVHLSAVELTPESRFEILVVRDVDALLDRIDPEAFKLDERLPYWAELWPASIALGRYLLSNRPPSGARVLELGCGLGLPAIVAAKLGCAVLATDYEEAALKFARYNALRNRVADRVAFRELDWRSPCLDQRFSYVLASDIWFDPSDVSPLVQLVDKTIQSGGILIGSDPNRSGIGWTFFQELARRGYDHRRTTFAVDHQGCVSHVGIHRLRAPKE